MADNKKALLSIAVVCMGCICFAIGATAVGLPLWGYFDNPQGLGAEKGYFGPWQVCKELQYNRERCGSEISRFRPVAAVYVAGLVAVGGVGVLGLFCILSVFQLAMVVSKKKVVMPYSVVVITKLAFALLATILAVVAAGLFALQTDDRERSFRVTRGEAFYIQLTLIALNFLLFIMALYDMLFARREGGDPTVTPYRDETGEAATTYNNPGFKERKNISVTDASAKPYVTHNPTGTNGSVTSMTTTTSSNGSMGSSITRSPLRSSLKKPRPKDGMGIQNPGFSGNSPPMGRNGSVKKVRIQTHSTAV